MQWPTADLCTVDSDRCKLVEAIALTRDVCKQVDLEVSMTDTARTVAIQNSLDFSHSSEWQKINLVDDGEQVRHRI